MKEWLGRILDLRKTCCYLIKLSLCCYWERQGDRPDIGQRPGPIARLPAFRTGRFNFAFRPFMNLGDIDERYGDAIWITWAALSEIGMVLDDEKVPQGKLSRKPRTDFDCLATRGDVLSVR